jgi:putative oxidoreductase
VTNKDQSPLERWAPYTLSVLRIIAAFLFLQHGSMKLFLVPAGQMSKPVELVSLLGLAGVLEFFGGLLLLMGLFTRTVAFILSGEMAVAYFYAHALHAFSPLVNRGELAVLYCFLYLYFVMVGGGAWSVDAFLKRGSASNEEVDEENIPR